MPENDKPGFVLEAICLAPYNQPAHGVNVFKPECRLLPRSQTRKKQKKTVSKNQIYPAHPRNHPKKEWTGDSLILLTGTPIKNRRNAASYVPKQLKIFLATD